MARCLINKNKKPMEEKEILEGNKLIAVFMGAECLSPKTKFSYFDFGDDWNKHEGIFQQKIHVRMLKYHEDWNWIMELIGKIYEVCKSNSKCHYYWTTHNAGSDIRIFIEPKITVFKEAVKFIKFYNKK